MTYHLDIPLDDVVTHELGHAVCADGLGLTVVELLLPMPFVNKDGRLYPRRAETRIDSIWTNEEHNELMPDRLDKIACVATAGVVAERLSQEPVNADPRSAATTSGWKEP